MNGDIESTEQGPRRATRRTVAATGVKLAYAAPIVAASFKVSARSAFAISGVVCGHSTGPNGGCKGACSSAGFTERQCNAICGDGASNSGACPAGQGGNDPCCNPGYCDPRNFKRKNTTPGVKYIGPTTGCPPTTK